MHRTIAFAIDFVLDVLDYSPDEPSIPLNETDLRLQPTADPMMKDVFCLVLWNDDKHSFEEVRTVILELSGKGNGQEREKEVADMVRRLEDEGRVMVDMNVVNTNPAMHGQQHAKLLLLHFQVSPRSLHMQMAQPRLIEYPAYKITDPPFNPSDVPLIPNFQLTGTHTLVQDDARPLEKPFPFH
ncbi:hypothetical protein NMY22_g13092 [Coprinellus aureogranulatus]|nr:hypothetical protein NMY22_g13092 [Coprinellus aureogranulatus]